MSRRRSNEEWQNNDESSIEAIAEIYFVGADASSSTSSLRTPQFVSCPLRYEVRTAKSNCRRMPNAELAKSGDGQTKNFRFCSRFWRQDDATDFRRSHCSHSLPPIFAFADVLLSILADNSIGISRITNEALIQWVPCLVCDPFLARGILLNWALLYRSTPQTTWNLVY